jgi:serine/threonine protein phosphatase 1
VTPRLPPGTRIYAIGDVHGRADLLDDLFTRIDAHLASAPVPQPIQVLLGDYIDRGPNSREVVDALIARRRRDAVVYLKGNHESYLIRFLEDPTVLAEWAQVGGAKTLLSYGVDKFDRHDPRQCQHAANAFREALPAQHYQFFRSLALSFESGDYFFAHAGVRPGVPLHEQHERDLLWIRRDFLQHEQDFGKIIVHGHSPTREPEVRPNRINIDTGAFETGRLTCLVLEGDSIAIL